MHHCIVILTIGILGVVKSQANDNPFGCSGDACVAKLGEYELQQTV